MGSPLLKLLGDIVECQCLAHSIYNFILTSVFLSVKQLSTVNFLYPAALLNSVTYEQPSFSKILILIAGMFVACMFGRMSLMSPDPSQSDSSVEAV